MPENSNSNILENFPLKDYNSFGINVNARFFFQFSEILQIQNFLRSQSLQNLPWLILGGGSNVLFTKDFEGLVIHPRLSGYEVIDENKESVVIKAAAGEIWDDFVQYCVSKKLYGIENLSLIPGSVGASPIQNIGAYGAEASDVIDAVHGIELPSGVFKTYQAKECLFGYRDSIFKKELKNKFLITSVSFRMLKESMPKLDYGNLREEVERLGEISLQSVRQAVISIRNSKLPDPAVTGNAGSFFKNPVVAASRLEKIKSRDNEVPSFCVSEDTFKIPAGWLIEKCGWKGKSHGNVGVYDKQALIIVNKGNATGKEIFEFSETILQCVNDTFGILLEREVNII